MREIICNSNPGEAQPLISLLYARLYLAGWGSVPLPKDVEQTEIVQLTGGMSGAELWTKAQQVVHNRNR